MSNIPQPAIRRLREGLQLSRDKFGDLIGKSGASIEKYETEITGEFALQLAKLATKHGFHEIAQEFLRMAGDREALQADNIENVSVAEREFLTKCLKIYRNPQDTVGEFWVRAAGGIVRTTDTKKR